MLISNLSANLRREDPEVVSMCTHPLRKFEVNMYRLYVSLSSPPRRPQESPPGGYEMSLPETGRQILYGERNKDSPETTWHKQSPESLLHTLGFAAAADVAETLELRTAGTLQRQHNPEHLCGDRADCSHYGSDTASRLQAILRQVEHRAFRNFLTALGEPTGKQNAQQPSAVAKQNGLNRAFASVEAN